MNELISIVGFFPLSFFPLFPFSSLGIPREWLTSFPEIVGLHLKSLRIGSTFKSSQLCILFHFRCRPRTQGEGRYLGCGLFFLHLQKGSFEVFSVHSSDVSEHLSPDWSLLWRLRVKLAAAELFHVAEVATFDSATGGAMPSCL